MKDEIKESINRIQGIVDFYKLDDENNYDYSDDVLISMKTLLDYITNLQEENEYQERIDKAIEYIEKYDGEPVSRQDYDRILLNILKGE